MVLSTRVVMCEYKKCLIFQLENTTFFWDWNKSLHGCESALKKFRRQCLEDIETQELEHNRRGVKELEVRLTEFAKKYVRRPRDRKWQKKRQTFPLDDFEFDW